MTSGVWGVGSIARAGARRRDLGDLDLPSPGMRLDLGGAENLVDQFGQTPVLGDDDLDEVVPLPRQQVRVIAQDLGGGPDRRQRGAQLLRQERQDIVPGRGVSRCLADGQSVGQGPGGRPGHVGQGLGPQTSAAGYMEIQDLAFAESERGRRRGRRWTGESFVFIVCVRPHGRSPWH